MTSAEPSLSKRPYVIYRDNLGCGFWSNFSCVLQGLDHAEQAGLIPVVDMERYPTRYHEDDDWLGTRNAWEYFFEQPAGLSLNDALLLDPTDNQGCTVGRFLSIHLVAPSDELTRRARKLLKKYIRIKPHVMAIADALMAPGVHENTLGVHVRGTDMRGGQAILHAVSSTRATYLDQAAQLDRARAFSKIFLASDERETVEMFQQHFGSRLITNDCHRTSAGDVPSEGYEWLFRPQRERHRYLLGLEVLVDALLLSRCGHMLCGISNVSQSAIYFSDEGQTVHAVPPIWQIPEYMGPSLGRDFVTTIAHPTNPPSAHALATQLEEMRRLLEASENARSEARVERDVLHGRLVKALLENGEFNGRLAEANCSLKIARKEIAALEKQTQKNSAMIALLQRRVLALVNGWTWLGWRLMPWTKPSWRHNPLLKDATD